jgi:hypothetical protein
MRTDRPSDSKEIPLLLRRMEDHYYVHSGPQLVPLPSQFSPIQTLTLKGSLKFILIIDTRLHPDLPSGVFPSRSLIKNVYAFLISHTHATCPAHLLVLELFTLIISGTNKHISIQCITKD